MDKNIGKRNESQSLTRRDFLWLMSVSTAGVITQCAMNPVTGKRQLMLMSEQDEIALDKAHAPHQFSADYGPVQDAALNQYISDVGNKMTALSHRPQMPYSFRVVNATYVNAYAFPGGSIATTRGILLSLEDEAELAALLGHEIGHVNGRHTAERMSKQQLIGAAVTLGSIAIAEKNEKYGALAAGLGSIGAGALLAHYSRDDEREADFLGMSYMAKGGYSPDGMVGLMDMLKSLSSHSPNVIEMMFSTHPMSDERYQTAKTRADVDFAAQKNQPLFKERYMDKIASLRKIEGAIKKMQEGEGKLMQQQFAAAESDFRAAIKLAPKDYTAHVLLSKCLLVQEKNKQASRIADVAQRLYPTEAQAHHLGGIAYLYQKNYTKAFEGFSKYEQILSGNPNTIFLKGFCQEGMTNKPRAAEEYMRYLQMVQQGEQADHARTQLVAWGYLEAPQEQQSQ